jgi:NADH dehydrogenase [ubiquinone] 1 alpha subcomplex assembly factor 5
VKTKRLIVDEEYLPFPPNHFDVVLSSLSLHWVNDLPSTFQQVCGEEKIWWEAISVELGGGMPVDTRQLEARWSFPRRHDRW